MRLDLWNLGFLPNKVREFCFKFQNDKLGLNTRISHFVANQTRQCSNCVRSGTLNADDETFCHFFISCPVNSRIQNWFLAKYLNKPVLGTENKKYLIFWGIHNGMYNELQHLIVMIVNYLIWDMKLQKWVFSPLTLDFGFLYLVKYCFKSEKRLIQEKNKLGPEINARLSWIV
jgi:hypothetical protein